MADIKIQLYKKTGSNFDSILLQNADWYGILNKPTTYTPIAHTHSKSQVGLSNVDNTSDETKYVQGLRETRANVNTKIWTGTQAQYDAIVTKDATTLYFIT